METRVSIFGVRIFFLLSMCVLKPSDIFFSNICTEVIHGGVHGFLYVFQVEGLGWMSFKRARPGHRCFSFR